MDKRIWELELNTEATMRNLKDIIYSSELSVEKIADLMGYDVRSINYWLSGETLPDIVQLSYICRIVNVSIEDIFVYNYQLSDSTLNNQKDHMHRLYESYRHSDSINRTMIYMELEKLDMPAYTINEMMMYLYLMDNETIDFLKSRFVHIGNSRDDLHYIRKCFKFVIEHIVPDSIDKKIVASDVNYATHTPSLIQYTTKKSLPEKTVRTKQWWNHCYKVFDI